MKKKSKSMALIVCQTPLQVLIAKKVICLHPDKSFYGVYIAQKWHRKNDYYAKKFSHFCDDFKKITLDSTSSFYGSLESILNIPFKQMFIASIDNPFLLAILSHKKNILLYTFDDGTANISPKSFYFRKSKQHYLIDRLQLTWDKERVKENVIKHYTIFKTDFNIVDKSKLVKIDLFDQEQRLELSNHYRKDSHNHKVISILLGQPLPVSRVENESIMIDVMQYYHIDYYFPHPRDEFELSEKTIITELVFEDYFFQLLKTYDKVIVYYFSSTVAFTLAWHSQLDFIPVDVNYLESWYFQEK